MPPIPVLRVDHDEKIRFRSADEEAPQGRVDAYHEGALRDFVHEGEHVVQARARRQDDRRHAGEAPLDLANPGGARDLIDVFRQVPHPEPAEAAQRILVRLTLRVPASGGGAGACVPIGICVFGRLQAQYRSANRPGYLESAQYRIGLAPDDEAESEIGQKAGEIAAVEGRDQEIGVGLAHDDLFDSRVETGLREVTEAETQEQGRVRRRLQAGGGEAPRLAPGVAGRMEPESALDPGADLSRGRRMDGKSGGRRQPGIQPLEKQIDEGGKARTERRQVPGECRGGDRGRIPGQTTVGAASGRAHSSSRSICVPGGTGLPGAGLCLTT